MQPSKYSKKNFKTELQKKPKTISKVLEKPAVLSYEELGGLSDPGPRDCVCRSLNRLKRLSPSYLLFISFISYLSRMSRR
jgi:hypothetical protein